MLFKIYLFVLFKRLLIKISVKYCSFISYDRRIISIYVIVMGINKCEKVFAGIFILIKNKPENLKSQQKLFLTHDTHFNNIYSFIQLYSNT